MIPIHEQLRAERMARGLSQKSLGARLGMPQSHLSAIEAGKVDPRLSSVLEIARSLEHDLVLVPRKLLPAVRSIMSGEPDAPLWQIDDQSQ
jgi:HTH-type transcriptional regulator/antitoxin HipB